MKTINAAAIVGLTAYAGLAHTAESQQSLGFYVGGEIGTAKSDNFVQSPVWTYHVDESTTGWGVFAGIRPLKFLGAEVNYIDFGTAKKDNISDGAGNITYQASATNDAITGYIVGYLPLLQSHWDVFAKAGYASLNTKTNSNGNYPNVYVCSGGLGPNCQLFGLTPIGMASHSTSDHQNAFAYGFGTQYQFGSVGVRVEYQKIDVSQAKPNMISVGVTWTF